MSEMQWWFVLAAIAIGLVLIALAVWRSFAAAAVGVRAIASTADGAVDALRPVASAAGHAIEGAGNILHGAGNIVDAFADAMRSKQMQRVQLAAENASLHAQIEQLRARKVNATAIERQLQVAFFSIQSKYTSLRQTTTPRDPRGWAGLERATSREFVGIIDAHFTAKVGVDLKKLRFGLKPDSNVVFVHGSREVQNIGLSDLRLEEPFCEARSVYHEGLLGSAIKVLPPDAELISESNSHRGQVLREIQNSTLTSSLAEANEKVAVGFFQALMGAGRFEFIAQSEIIDDPLTFEQLCDQINGSISEKIDELETARKVSTEQANNLDIEIIELATQHLVTHDVQPRVPRLQIETPALTGPR